MYVEKEHRQHGYFKQLYQSVRVQAQRAGAAGLRLYADDGNESAHRTVERTACYAAWCHVLQTLVAHSAIAELHK